MVKQETVKLLLMLSIEKVQQQRFQFQELTKSCQLQKMHTKVVRCKSD